MVAILYTYLTTYIEDGVNVKLRMTDDKVLVLEPNRVLFCL